MTIIRIFKFALAVRVRNGVIFNAFPAPTHTRLIDLVTRIQNQSAHIERFELPLNLDSRIGVPSDSSFYPKQYFEGTLLQ